MLKYNTYPFSFSNEKYWTEFIMPKWISLSEKQQVENKLQSLVDSVLQVKKLIILILF